MPTAEPAPTLEPRAVCAGCGRPAKVCVCAELVRVPTRTRVLILQHPRESNVPIGTARLAELMLPNSERHVGVELEDTPRVRELLTDPTRPAVLLYPGPGAEDIVARPPAGPVTLVVIDGTWWQAQKLFKKNPKLAGLPRYALEPPGPSRYRIRREPAAHCVSTIEAITLALAALEQNEGVSALLKPFDAMVEHQIRFATERRAKRHVTRTRGARARRFPAAFSERAHDLVVGYGEANAWPRATELGDGAEIVHLVLERLASGERFEAFIAPRRPLSPSFEHHTGIANERVLAAEPFGAFLERFHAFVRPSDVLAGWGHFWSEALAREGVALPERVDLRVLARQHLRERTGDVLDCAKKLGVPAVSPWAAGRTGRRAAGALAVARALVRAAAESSDAAS
ncbi:MAG TPA: DTW domain-containing protein [Polyangiaceae bacterium]|nr:DTW domain-containing protein [Polyangiaceae bacterium]